MGLQRQVGEKRGEEGGEDGEKEEEEDRRERHPICLFFIIHFFLFGFFLAALGLHCFVQASYSCGKQGLLFVGVCGGFSCWGLQL